MQLSKNIPAELADLCPKFRYVKSLQEESLRDFFAATSEAERDTATLRALDLARLISNVIEPLCRDCGQNGFASEYKRLAEKLYDLGRPWTTFHPSDFPPAPDKTGIILDRLEQLEQRLAKILTRRQAAQERRAAA